MDSTFLLYLYTMIVIGCITAWLVLYNHFVQSGLMTRPAIAEVVQNSSQRPPPSDAGQQPRASPAPVAQGAEGQQLPNVNANQPESDQKAIDGGQFVGSDQAPRLLFEHK